MSTTSGFMQSGQGGFRQPTKQTRVEKIKNINDKTVQKVAELLEDNLQKVSQGTAQALDYARNELLVMINQLRGQLGELDYYRRAFTDVLEDHAIPRRELFDALERIKLSDFEEETAKDVAHLKAKPVSDSPIQRGDLITFAVKSFYGDEVIGEDGQRAPNPMAGKEFAPYTVLRGKMLLGDQRHLFRPVFQENLVGMKTGEEKRFSFQLTPNVTIHSEVKVLAAYRPEPKPETPAEAPTIEAVKVEAVADDRPLGESDFNSITEGN